MARCASALLVVLLAINLFLAAAVDVSSTCNVRYDKSGPPLLFGGVHGRCSEGCANRAGDWPDTCAYNASSSTWGVCTPEQAANSFALAKHLGEGAILDMSPCDLVPFLRGRTLWLIGDSHSKSLYRALQCFLLDFWDHTECTVGGSEDDAAALRALPASEGISNCFHLTGAGGGRVCMVHVVLATSLVNNTEVANGGVLPLLRARFASPSDIFYISVGAWHRKTPEWGAAYEPALRALAADHKAHLSTWPHLLFREAPAIHPTDASRNVCLPFDGYTYEPSTGQLSIAPAAANASIMWGNGYTLAAVARSVLRGRGVPVVPSFNLTATLPDNHVGVRLSPALDCLHYCSPGAPEAWIYLMYRAFQRGRAGIAPLDLASPPAPLDGDTDQQQQQQQEVPGQYTCVRSTIRL